MIKPAPTPRQRRRGELLLHPLAILAVVVLVINDHVLKPLVPGLLTGKLSDVAGLLFFPLLLVSVVEIAALALRRVPPDRRRLTFGSITVTALGFGLVKTTAIGTAAFAWSLGTAQWLASAGAFSGDGPRPVGVATDPGDLVAMIAFVGTLWVARGTRGFGLPSRRRLSIGAGGEPSRRAVAILVFASLATMASGSALQQSYLARYEERIHLDADHLAVMRHLSYDVENNDPGLRQVVLSAGVPPNEPQLLAKLPPIVMTLTPDHTADVGAWHGTGDIFGGPALDVTDSCRSSCHHGATFIANLNGPAPAAGVDFTLQVELLALNGPMDGNLDTNVTLRNDPDRAFEGNPASLGAATKGRYSLTSSDTKAKVERVINIAAGALNAPLEYPLVATVTVYLTGDTLESADDPLTYATVGGMRVRLLDGSRTSMVVTLLCKAGHACQIPVVITSTYSPQSPPVPGATPRIGSARQSWHIEAQVQAFDGRRLPADAVSIGAR